MRALVAITCCWLITAAGSAALWAGVLLVETRRPFRRGAHVTTTTLRIEPGWVSIDKNGPEGRETILFHAEPLMVRVVNHEERFYREFGEQSLGALRKGLQQTRAAMRRRAGDELKRMSPEQRKQMQASIKARLHSPATDSGGAPQPAPVYTQVWSGEQVNRWECDRYEGRVDGEKVWDACVVTWARLDVTPGELAAFDEAIETLESLHLLDGYALADIKSKRDAKARGYAGIPIQRIRLRAERPAEVFEVQELEHREFTDADFSPPAGYQQRTVVMMSPSQPSRDRKGAVRHEP